MNRWEKRKAIVIFTISMMITPAMTAQNWQTTGNSGTDPSANFIGTTDSVDLVFRTNNLQRVVLTASGFVGINNVSPLARFHISNGAVLFDGNTGSTPVSGGGTRMMWIPAKAAFRAGNVGGTEWDDANIGLGSFAVGVGTKASGASSVALGQNSSASGSFSFATGSNTQSIGAFSKASGSGSVANNSFSSANGNNSIANGDFSFAEGNSATTSGAFAFSRGNSTSATGSFAFAEGESGTLASGSFAFARGSNAKATGNFSFATGNSVTSSGDFSFSTGNGNTASGVRSFATGNSVIASGTNAFATGNSSTAGGTNSFATGNQVTTAGSDAFATGNTSSANGNCSFAIGHSVTAQENCAIVLGKGVSNSERLINNAPNSLMIGFNSDLPTLFVGNSAGTGTTGNVGIGTMTPGAKLTVNGLIESTSEGIKFPDGTIQATAAGSGGSLDSLKVKEFIEVGNSIFITANLNQIFTDYNVKIPGSDPYLFIQSNSAFDNHTIINAGNNGSVGIGTAKPGMGYAGTLKLDVRGHARFGANDNDYVRLGFNGANSIMDNYGAGSLLINYYSGKAVHIGTGAAPGDLFTGGNVYLALVSGKQVGIGTTQPGTFKLAVEGKVGAREFVVTLQNPWPDYVFHKSHKLMSLHDLEEWIKTKQHLPGIPTAEEVKEQGLSLGDMQAQQMQKIEELYLYLIEIQKQLDALQKENALLKKQIAKQ